MKLWHALVYFITAVVTSAAAAQGWTPNTFPNPTEQGDLCNRPGLVSFVCDADSLLSKTDLDTIEVGQTASSWLISCLCRPGPASRKLPHSSCLPGSTTQQADHIPAECCKLWCRAS